MTTERRAHFDEAALLAEAQRKARTPIDAYADTVGARKKLIKLAGDKFPGDPRRIADAVLMVTEQEKPPLHLLLGHDVYKAYREKLSGLMASIEEWKDVTLDVNFPSKR